MASYSVSVPGLPQIEAKINKAITIAVKNTCERLTDDLQEIISAEFYSVYRPEKYLRTYQFLYSAVTEMVNNNVGAVFMDAGAMHYKEITGAEQLELAAVGSHGGYSTDETENHRFWEVFIDYCNHHAVEFLKEELKKQGIPIVK